MATKPTDEGGVMDAEEIARVVIDLADWFSELDDSGEGVFGEYARVEDHADDGYLIVKHQDAERGVRVTVSAL